MKKQIKKLVALSLATVMALAATGCGGKKGSADAGDRTIIFFAASHVTADLRDSYLELVKTYNDGQGKEDGIYVEMMDSAGALAGLESMLQQNYMYDVIQLTDREFKPLVVTGTEYFVPLDDYLTEDVKKAMEWDDIPDSLVNRFRMNQTTDENKIYQAGEGASLLALPIGSDPNVFFYNKAILEDCGFNFVSVQESKLDAYNKENNAKLQPHGYAEYKEAPFADAVSCENEAGQTVYKVFNDAIAMNWEEQRLVARAVQQQYGYDYGFLSELWFNMGFSIGADCIGWNESISEYEFTLMEKKPNYLALEDITVNGKDYKKGEVLRYEEKNLLNNDAGQKSALSGKVYELPSNYDMILEFTRLGVPADKEADNGIYGYGVAPDTVENRQERFVSGTECPLYLEYFSKNLEFKKFFGDNLGMAVPTQYREYAGGSTYTNGGEEYLKVIGETYDGVVYTGELHYEGDTAIVGRATTANLGNGLLVPKNTENKNYDEAFKFASWVASLEGQKILAKNNAIVPNQTTYGLGEYAESEDRATPNMWAGAYVAQEAEIGDYTYFTSITWITEWSQAFNQDVREGKMTLTEFIAAKKELADHALKGMNIRMNGR